MFLVEVFLKNVTGHACVRYINQISLILFMKPKISIDTPISELTVRRYEKPYNLSRRELVRKLCLSIGILQPGDSRDVIVDLLYVMLEAKMESKVLSSEEITRLVIELRKAESLELNGVAGSNIRRQLKRLREVHIVEKVKNNYRITEFLGLKANFDEKIMKYMLPSILERVREYFDKVDEVFANKNEIKSMNANIEKNSSNVIKA